MKKQEEHSIINHYTKLFKKYGINSASLGWKRGNQSIRFHAITQIGKIANSSILDVGCGFGHLNKYLELHRISAHYTGVDVNQKFIEIAKKNNPKCKFEVRDIEKKPFKNKFDWVFCDWCY